jgi:hypothetical protein
MNFIIVDARLWVSLGWRVKQLVNAILDLI